MAAYSRAQVDAKLRGYYTKAEVDALLARFYTKAEVDALLAARLPYVLPFRLGGSQ